MSTYLPEDLLAGLTRAGADAGLTARAGGRSWRVTRRGPAGFAVDGGEEPPLPGLIDLYGGREHLLHCLVVRVGTVGTETLYEFKRATPVRADAPRDFVPVDAAALGIVPPEAYAAE